MESILKQSFTDFELLTVCDNPDYIPAIDMIREKARKDPRIRLIENDRNLGQTISLNIGIATSRGEYIARMDADVFHVVLLILREEFSGILPV